MYVTSSNDIVYIAAPCNRTREIGYYLDAFMQDCRRFAENVDMRAPIFVESGVDSGEPLENRPILNGILQERWWRGSERRRLVVPFYECLSIYPSELMAIIKDLAGCGLEVWALHEPELYYHPHLRCGSALGNHAPWPGRFFDRAEGWRSKE